MFSGKNTIKSWLRPLRDALSFCFGFFYDCFRYSMYSAYKGSKKDPGKRDYRAVKIYHRLEKSLAFRARNAHSGKDAVEGLTSLLAYSGRDGIWGFHQCVSLRVLDEFKRRSSLEFVSPIPPASCNKVGEDVGGSVEVTATELEAGRLQDPETFFFSRYSVRDFSSEKVDQERVKRALKLALKTPSVCNRQGWFVYHTDDRETIDACLSFQNGNRGFGHEVPSLMILAADLKAFDTAGERYQQWIDGGMFSMSLVYALHSLGISSCCLNWSKTASADLQFRRAFSVKPHHSILMMLAVGYPKEKLRVCYSARRSVDSMYEYWG